MIESRQIAWPAYVVSVAMVAIPLADVWASLYPWRFVEARWRFGAVGLVSNSLLIPMVGLLLAYLTATILYHRITRRTIGAISFLAAAFCLAALGLFALDAVQTRAAVRPEMRVSFNVASAAAAIKTLFATATFMAIGIVALRGSKERFVTGRPADVPLFKVNEASVESVKPSGLA